jgi:hypothetical protein
MWTSLLTFCDQYHGWALGFAVLASVLLANQLIYRHGWTSYRTREAYLAAHPGCETADGVICSECGQKAASMPVQGRGRIFRCAWCDTDLYRVDRT